MVKVSLLPLEERAEESPHASLVPGSNCPGSEFSPQTKGERQFEDRLSFHCDFLHESISKALKQRRQEVKDFAERFSSPVKTARRCRLSPVGVWWGVEGSGMHAP